jgi:hypothetical protein
MEFREKEVQAVLDALVQSEVLELNDLQLVLVGGGSAETSL